MTLHLPDLTLVAIDTAYHRLTEQAINTTLQHISVGDILLFTDRALDVPTATVWPCIVRSNAEAQDFLWHSVARRIKTSHALVVQWDGFVTRPDLWRDDFLLYDYIGAPWPWHATNRVGNGGFSLRSRRLLQTVASNPDLFPFHVPADETLGRTYRPFLEARFGLRWADDATATAFSRGWTADAAFGFHGVANFLHVLDDADCLAKLDLFTPAQCHSAGLVDLWLAAREHGRPVIADKAAAMLGGSGIPI